MNDSPNPRRFLFADGINSLYPSELPQFIAVGDSVETGRLFLLNDSDRAAHMYVCGITGSGKSRFLENMILQDICAQRPLCVIDPTGGLYRKALDFIAFACEISKRQGHNIDQLLESYLFLDLDSEENPLRLNPLEPQGSESTEEQVDDFLKVAERLFGSIDEMRRLRNTLRNTLWVIAELNRLPQSQQPRLASPFSFPLNLRFAAQFLAESDEYRQRLISAIPNSEANSYAAAYWTKFFAEFTTAQKQERLESTWNILQYFLGDSLVSRFLDVQKSTLHIPDLLAKNRSLFCSIPLGKNLKGCQLIGTYLATKFQRSAYRRPPEQRFPYYLYIDEFHEFADIEFAKAATTLRQYNLRMVNAHQSQSQPPFHNAEGKAILETIKANAQVKVLFRLSREDAEIMARELFALTQRRHNFTYQEISSSSGTTASTTKTVSFQRSFSRSDSWSRADSVAIAESETYGIAKSEGVSLGRTLTEGFGDKIDESISQTITETESETVTEMRSKAHGISVLIGKNWSHTVDHTNGISYSTSGSESLAIQRGSSETLTNSEQRGVTQTDGQNYSVSDGRGNSLVHTQGQTAYHHGGGSVSTNAGSALGTMHNHVLSQGNSYSTAIQDLRSTANAVGRSNSETSTRQTGSELGGSQSQGMSDATGGNESTSITETDTVSESRAKLQGHSRAQGRALSIGQSHQVALAEAFTQLKQFTRSLSQALQRTVSQTETLGGSTSEGVSFGSAEATATGTNRQETLAERKVFFTLEGEREIAINELQRLPQRHCVIAKEALAAAEIITPRVPNRYYSYRDHNLPAEIIKRQLSRFGAEKELSPPAPALVPYLPEEPDDHSPWSF